MGIWSIREAFQNARFIKPRSAAVYPAESVVVVNDGPRRSIIVKLADGQGFISSEYGLEDWSTTLAHKWYAQSHFKALKALGVITQADIDAHNKWCAEGEAETKRRYAAEAMARGFAESGLKPTKAQERFIQENAKKKRAA